MASTAFFTGNFHPRLDDKGRLTLPAKFREALTGGVMVAPGYEHCLQVWSVEGFAESAAELRRKSQSDRETRRYTRFLFSTSSDEHADKQGRIPINAQLRDYARIDRDVVVVGVMDHVEIWNPELWAASQGGADEDYANLDGPFGFVET